MKNSELSILALLVLLCVSQTGCFDPPRPVGEWIASGTRDAIIFHQDGTFEILFYATDRNPPPPNAPGYSEGTEIPGSGKWRLREQGTYNFDSTKDPAWIDLVITKQGSSRRQEGLIQFLDANTFYMAVEDVRPATIDSSSRKTRCTRAAPNEIKR